MSRKVKDVKDVRNIRNDKIYDSLCNEYREAKNEFTKEQFAVYESIILFLMGLDKNKIIEELNHFFIPNIYPCIIEKLSCLDYPKTNVKLGLLNGGAGTGKTYLVSHIVLKLSKILSYKKTGTIQILAPTNKALKVIKDKISSNENIHFQTISKFLEQVIEYTEDGKVVYKTKIDIDTPYYQDIKYVIIDESSMISKKNWTDLNSFVFNKLNIKILLIGDKCQLPPVGEENSVVFNIECKKFSLNKIVRTQSNDISNMYNLYRDAVINNEKINSLYENKVSSDSSDIKYVLSFEDCISEFDYNYDKFISYSNNSVDKYNEYIRNVLFNSPQEEYVIGEKLIFGSSVKLAIIPSLLILTNIEIKYFYSNDEATVMNVESIYLNTNFINRIDVDINKNIFLEDTFEVYKLQIRMENGEEVIIYKIKENELIHFDEYCKNTILKIKKISKFSEKKDISKFWDIFYTLKNTIYSPIKYSYALTVYKSQGSTFRKIFVDMNDMKICVKDKSVLSKSLYTAITRGAEKIFCYKKSTSDYYSEDLKKYPFLKKNIKIEHSRIYSVLKDSQNIIYTRNEYQNNNRKLIRGRVVYNGKKINISNGTFTWEFKIKDDFNIYI